MRDGGRLTAAIGVLTEIETRHRPVRLAMKAWGEGARYATLCLNPSAAGCTTPTATAVKAKIDAAVYGIGPGSFNTPLPTLQTSGTSKYYDLTVNYTQATDLLLLPGPTITVKRSKRVWVAGS